MPLPSAFHNILSNCYLKHFWTNHSPHSLTPIFAMSGQRAHQTQLLQVKKSAALHPTLQPNIESQSCLQSLTHTLKITSDLTNKRAESTLNSSPA